MSDTKKQLHIVHLSYTVPRPAYTDPDEWLQRVKFINGVPEALARYAKQTVIYNIGYKGEITRNGVTYLFPAFKQRQLYFPLAFNRFIRKLKPDVVIVHGLIFPMQIIMLRNIMGSSLKIICQHHAERPFKDIRKYLSRWADWYIGAYLFASHEQAAYWAPFDKVYPVIGASSHFRATNKKHGSTYLWVGDLNHNKNPLRVARAFVRFANEHADAVLYMIYPSNELEKELKEIVAGTTAVQLIGKVEHSQMENWFNKADYIISSSFYEGSGIAVCEALSCGCIPVVSNIPSFFTMTNSGRLGTMFSPNDEETLDDALEKSYYLDRKRESRKALEFFQAELSFEANARKIMEVIHKI
ncbi:MAG TPA: glycosyltransferase family 4 protein [Cyclobacteriaceae bacterium]|nr:glycosyltransferase family 4 protein [Cyclobacteriaceae bacterium]